MCQAEFVGVVPFFRTRCLRVSLLTFLLFSPLKECQLKVFVTFVNCQVDVTRGRIVWSSTKKRSEEELRRREIFSFNTCPDT